MLIQILQILRSVESSNYLLGKGCLNIAWSSEAKNGPSGVGGPWGFLSGAVFQWHRYGATGGSGGKKWCQL